MEITLVRRKSDLTDHYAPSLMCLSVCLLDFTARPSNDSRTMNMCERFDAVHTQDSSAFMQLLLSDLEEEIQSFPPPFKTKCRDFYVPLG